MTGFELEVHPYCSNCNDFQAEVEEIDYEEFFGDGAGIMRTITCRYFKRCQAIEKHLRKEIENENNTGKLRDTD